MGPESRSRLAVATLNPRRLKGEAIGQLDAPCARHPVHLDNQPSMDGLGADRGFEEEEVGAELIGRKLPIVHDQAYLRSRGMSSDAAHSPFFGADLSVPGFGPAPVDSRCRLSRRRGRHRMADSDRPRSLVTQEALAGTLGRPG